jgi:mono/diheme cytochrome c family protein
VPVVSAFGALLTGLAAPEVSISAQARQDATPGKSVRQGIYTIQQAKRGEDQYQLDCSSCHGATLSGGESGSALIGTDFISDWTGKTVADLFEYTRTAMPKDSPGRLSRQQYADVIAFILSENKFPAGESELKADPEMLQPIRFEAP